MKILTTMKGILRSIYQWWLQGEIAKIERKLEQKLKKRQDHLDMDDF